MKQIFAPWRMEYIVSKKPEGCVFCDLPRAGVSEETLVLFKGERAFVIMNRYPYVSGHLMVVPYRHLEHVLLLDPEEWAEMNRLVVSCVQALKAVYQPHGFNIGMNVGQAAGAGIHEHIHTHIIPRWTGDNNLVPVMTETRVIPESLEETWRKLIPEFRKEKKEEKKQES
ncbi:MAG: HIT domain-containing protein [Deltaproteobacteria bacterium]|nr:HIT domain-containing protein [Deltaproteobacteria bacterium]